MAATPRSVAADRADQTLIIAGHSQRRRGDHRDRHHRNQHRSGDDNRHTSLGQPPGGRPARARPAGLCSAAVTCCRPGSDPTANGSRSADRSKSSSRPTAPPVRPAVAGPHPDGLAMSTARGGRYHRFPAFHRGDAHRAYSLSRFRTCVRYWSSYTAPAESALEPGVVGVQVFTESDGTDSSRARKRRSLIEAGVGRDRRADTLEQVFECDPSFP